MKNIISYLVLALIIIFTSSIFIPELLAQTAEEPVPSVDQAGDMLNQTAGQAGYSTASGEDIRLAEVIGDVIFYLLGLLGVIFFVLIIYGGVIWMTAGGNEQHIEKAHKIIVNAAGGLVVIFLSGIITWFVIDILFKATTPVTTPTP